MTLQKILPHWNAGLNVVIVILLLGAFTAIRRGNRTLHPRLMLAAVSVGVLFLLSYLLQVWLTGHQRFPGHDWVRKLFLWILLTHTVLAVAIVPILFRTLFLAYHQRFDKHKSIARWTFGIWMYVATTGIVIYWMNNHLRPPTS